MMMRVMQGWEGRDAPHPRPAARSDPWHPDINLDDLEGASVDAGNLIFRF